MNLAVKNKQTKKIKQTTFSIRSIKTVSSATTLSIVCAIVFSAALSTPSWAQQYVWINDNGVREYSDMPPPVAIPQKRILKTLSASPSSSTPSNAPPSSIAEKNADFQKRKTEQTLKEKQSAEQAQIDNEKKKNCAHMQHYQRTLQSDERIATLDKNGERIYLNDEQRQQELQEAKRLLKDCKENG